MQIDGNRLIEAMRQQRNEAMDAAALLQVQLDAARAELEQAKANKEGGDGEA